MIRYEYRSIFTNVATLSSDEVLEQLNELGSRGWKLATAVPQERHGYSHQVHLLLMRRVDVGAADST